MTTAVLTADPPRLAWLCGAYEPGCDGVGDYVRRVSGAFAAGGGGEQVVLALRDSWVTEPRETGNVLRLPVAWPVTRAVERAVDFLDRVKVEILAWNFVPQMFAPRGIIPAGTANAYARLRADRRVILFMHELWCGIGRQDTVRNWILGAVQRRGVLHWLEQHQPDCVLTSNAAYAAVLQHHGVVARIVPLCSNISRTSGANRSGWPRALAGDAITAEPRRNWILAGVFGAIRPTWEPARALADLAAHAGRAKKRVAVVWFGRGSAAAEASWARVVDAIKTRIHFVRVGAVDEAAASELLASCDLGLPTVQFNLLGKSGTAAAFVEHGIPSLVVSDAWWPRCGLIRPLGGHDAVLWSAESEFAWGEFLNAGPKPGRTVVPCVQGWRDALNAASGTPEAAAKRRSATRLG